MRKEAISLVDVDANVALRLDLERWKGEFSVTITNVYPIHSSATADEEVCLKHMTVDRLESLERLLGDALQEVAGALVELAYDGRAK